MNYYQNHKINLLLQMIKKITIDTVQKIKV